ncbi:TonB-dependent receptor domain-containing protein [Nostoc sp. UHCC 0870]|uniref:TonB-dependent receptor domain-containing protein n=1 Tax=Nostoc sp. UHCC 0870 TaxID=2914041 RepID=UPI001EDD83C3|nr:TonB-dependent receptor [Nostoc sp. UHCC 0870]UKO96930.1 TonB-dependent receptor [Nostoc sp. UHCC 0870]
MRSWCLSVHLSFLISLSGCLSIVAVSSVWAGEKQQDVDIQNQTSSQIRQLSEIELPTTNAQLLVQSPTPSNPPVVPGSIVTITGVKANPTDKGVEVILETTLGEQLQVTNRSAENNFIADIPNAQLRLPSGEAFTFRSEKPVEGITEITVTNIDANTVRVAVVGENALPTVELFDDDAGLVLAVASTATATQPPETPQAEEKPASETPAAQQDEPIELVVTGEQDSYRVPNASTATRTDTSLRDIPQSIQVVPRQVLEERQPRTLTEAVETVSGVVPGGSLPGSVGRTIIRGFSQQGNFRNGFRDVDRFGITGIGTIEQVEVLKGPASVLFGALEPGGIVNVITRQPLSEPYYNFAFEAGNYGFYQPSIDLSGPLTADNTLLYRFIASYQGADSFQDFVNSQQTTIAPSITLNLGDRTSLNLYYEYISTLQAPSPSGAIVLSDGSLTPRNLYIGYPDISRYDVITQRYGSANLAAYQITKTNVTTSDPDRPRFSIQTGEQQSQGIELDVTGEISPGWNVIASYAYTDAKVTADNRFPIGSRLYGVPNHQASLWTSYTIQGGDLKGLGFGLGLFYVGERQGSGNLADPFILDPYLRTDAAIYYRRDRLKAAINIRNLFDIDYSSFALGNTYVVRDAPFTITGSISWEF